MSGWQTLTRGLNWPATCFCTVCELRIYILHVSQWLKKKSEEIIFCYMGKSYNFQISSFINNILLQHSHTRSFMFVCDCFRASKARVAATEPACAALTSPCCLAHCWLHWPRYDFIVWVPGVPRYLSILLFYYRCIT